MSRKRQCSSGSEIIVLYASKYCFFATNANTDSHFDPTASDLAEYSGKDRPQATELPWSFVKRKTSSKEDSTGVHPP